ncbi:MAG: hypothetical protein M1829_001890 [Trizodia sp. TS-e1964]|nr:MAG: hypothetical protein M1829_001890 [Trizodia sp. TS-e1964]
MAIPNTPTSQESTAEGHRLASHFSELQNQLDADVNDIKDKLDEHQNTLLSNIQQHFEDNKTLQTQFSSQVASRLGSIDGNVSLVQQQSRTMGVLMERFNSRQEEILEEIGATEARSKIRQEQIMEKILEKILEVKIAVEARSNEQERLLRECLAVTRTARTVGAEVHPALRPSQGERLGGEGATTRPPFPPFNANSSWYRNAAYQHQRDN